MIEILKTYDNNLNCPLHITNDMQLTELRGIAGRTLSSLCTDGEDGNLLVFPKDLSEYGDDIGNSCIFEIEGNTIYTNNLMGFVGIGDTMLKIGSRFDRDGNDYFMHYMLQRIFSVNMLDLQYSYNSEDIFDFILFLFPYYLKRALSQGVYKEYRTFERNDSRIRGVLDVNRHIRLNYPATGAIAYRSREHTLDNNITELIRHTIEYIKTKEFGDSILRCDEDTKYCVSQIVQATNGYERNQRQYIINRNLRPRIHPLYFEYDNLRKLCLQILRHEEIKYGEDKEKVYGVVFDGAWLWEEYLNTILSPLDILHPKNKTKEGGIYLFANRTGRRYPDFMGNNIILDAKYKGYGSKNLSEIERNDIAQIISYMYVEQAEKGVLISPGNDSLHCVSNTLRGYGGTMSLVSIPISKAMDYESFTADMSHTEKDLSAMIYQMMASRPQ